MYREDVDQRWINRMLKQQIVVDVQEHETVEVGQVCDETILIFTGIKPINDFTTNIGFFC